MAASENDMSRFVVVVPVMLLPLPFVFFAVSAIE